MKARTQLAGELATLQKRIERSDARDVIGVASLRARLRQIESELESLPPERAAARAKITFSGRPVVDSHGIRADFGAKAVAAFTDAVAAVAASLQGNLAAMGPIPNRDQNQLLITGVALGSFGFELEEGNPVPVAEGDTSSVAQAIERAERVLEASISNDDEILSDALTDISQRALDKVREFVRVLADNDALCTLHVQEKRFAFLRRDDVNRSLARISKDNVHEERRSLRGMFVGAQPRLRRTFEFEIADSGQVIVGKFSPELPNAEHALELLRLPIEIEFVVTIVGNGNPRYLLERLP